MTTTATKVRSHGSPRVGTTGAGWTRLCQQGHTGELEHAMVNESSRKPPRFSTSSAKLAEQGSRRHEFGPEDVEELGVVDT